MPHPHVEYMIECETHKLEVYTSDPDKAAVQAFSHATCGCPVNVDVLIYSEDGARNYGGEDAVERYRADPDASAFEHWVVTVTYEGRIP